MTTKPSCSTFWLIRLHVSNRTINLVGVAPCNQEEADTRIFVHARHVTEAGSKVIMIKDSDTDVVVIAVSVLQALQELGLQQFGLPLAKDSTCSGFLYMTCGALLQKRAKRCSSSMPSLAAMSFQHSMTKGRRLLGKPGMFVIRLPVSSATSVSTHR